MNTARFNIDGLEDVETQDKVKNQLEGIIGVGDISFNAGLGYAEVDYDEQTSIPDISSHLKNNGYKINDVC